MSSPYPELDDDGNPLLPLGVQPPYYAHYALIYANASNQSPDWPGSVEADDSTRLSRPKADSMMTVDIVERETDRYSNFATQCPSYAGPVIQDQPDEGFTNSGSAPATTHPDNLSAETPAPTKKAAVSSVGDPAARSDDLEEQGPGIQEIRAYLAKQGLRLRLYLPTRKGEQKMEWYYAAGPEHPALFQDAVILQKQFNNLKLDSRDRRVVLEAVGRYCGKKWVDWRKGRADWIAGGGIEKRKAKRRELKNRRLRK
ncbi:hypothetical protein QFC20_007827 [Naganishia adeliensis]|uniref:Uncharacterized protein n=1 Tax=Naganishia adeliensis TaxID=92952 RepID=A0ACC2UVP5_9TREE|nr:hypothetical protein QFC20_007827 [Naganishia adeliensis]